MGLNTAPTFSVLITGGTIVDGTGGPAYRADVGLQGDSIAAIGDLGSATADTTVDASGLTVTPGFIDVHVHSELALLAGHDSLVGARQGITTNLLHPDGFGWAPLDSPQCEELFAYTATLYGGSELEARWPTIDSYLDRFAGTTPLERVPAGPALRRGACGRWDGTPATPPRTSCRRWSTVPASGWTPAPARSAWGWTTSRAPTPASTSWCASAGSPPRHGGIYAAHQRYSHLGRPVAWRETIELAKASGCPVARQPRACRRGLGRGAGAGGARGGGPLVRVLPVPGRHDPPGDGDAHPRCTPAAGRPWPSGLRRPRLCAASRWQGWPSTWDAAIRSSATAVPAAMSASAPPTSLRRPESRSRSSPSTSSWRKRER